MTDLERKEFLFKIIYLILILLGVTVFLVIIVLLFSERYDLTGWVNALFFTGFLNFAFGWMMFVSNENLFLVPIYGVKQFLLGLIGRTPKKDLYEYRESRTYIPIYIIVTTICYGSILMLISIIIHYIFNN